MKQKFHLFREYENFNSSALLHILFYGVLKVSVTYVTTWQFRGLKLTSKFSFNQFYFIYPNL